MRGPSRTSPLCRLVCMRTGQPLSQLPKRVTMKIIVPCAGRSSRFPNMPPKWMLPDYDGVPMVVKAVQGLGVPVEDLIITVLKEHEERFHALEGLRQAFGQKVRGVILEKPTASQSETVFETLIRAGL